VPLCINVKEDRPIGALVLAIQSIRGLISLMWPFSSRSSCFQAKCAIMFHMTGITRRPPRPAANFSKANWGDHTIYDADGYPVSVYPTSTIVDLIHQLKPRQWEKVLAAGMEDSKVALHSEATGTSFASSSLAIPASQDQPKPNSGTTIPT
jgi:hypothetical protein